MRGHSRRGGTGAIRGRGQIDEERRLLYVSLTRAKHALFVTYSIRRSGQQARAGTGRTQHEWTRFLDGIRLTSRPGMTFVSTLEPDPALLSPIFPANDDVDV